jgi:hypothetical protein
MRGKRFCPISFILSTESTIELPKVKLLISSWLLSEAVARGTTPSAGQD